MDAYNLDRPKPDLQYMAENPASAAYLNISTGQTWSLSHYIAKGLSLVLAKFKACYLIANTYSPRVLS